MKWECKWDCEEIEDNEKINDELYNLSWLDRCWCLFACERVEFRI
jgi:hypothetical protein